MGDVSSGAAVKTSLGGSNPDYTQLVLWATAAALLTGGVVFWFMTAKAAGDEPPIRVRGGSMNLDLVGAGTEEWVGDDWAPSVWALSEGQNNGERFTVDLAVEGTCPSNAPSGTKMVRVTHSDGETIVFQHLQKRVVVKTPQMLKKSARWIQYPMQGTITKLEMKGGGPEWSCSFNETRIFKGLCLCVGACPVPCSSE